MKAWLYGIVGSIITAIIVTSFNHYFLQQGPEKPSIDAYQSTISLPLYTGNDIIQAGLAKLIADGRMTPASGVDALRKHDYDFNSGFVIQKFVISNFGGKIYKNLNLKLSGFKVAAVDADGNIEYPGDSAKDYTIAPNEKIEVYGLADDSGFSDSSGGGDILISVGDDPVQIRKAPTDEQRELSATDRFFLDTPVYGLLLGLALLVFAGLGLLAVAFSLLVIIFPRLYIKSASDNDFGRAFGVLKVIASEDPDRYAIIEKIGEKWMRTKLLTNPNGERQP
ncbi:hypothetical protein NKI38_24540 [Mesorhizobium sp. M0621]|uniref:hypothetical protein n=1 Tax=Mesorhizobium sp. M0621 TaxID=2956974 RepID=UPI003339A59C